MIKYCTDFYEVIPIWQDAFGDSVEDIEFFIDNINHAECLGRFDGDTLVSMMFIVDCNIKYCSSKYIYAACTKSNCGGMGYMTELIDFCKEKYDSLCLIPATDSLVDFYNKRGFNYNLEIEHISFDETDEITEYLLEGYELTVPKALVYERSEEDGLHFFS